MKAVKKYWKFLVYVPLIIGLVACGNDDSPDQMPMVDCNVTGPTLSITGTDLSGCGLDDGSVALAITGGTGTNAIEIAPQPEGVNFDQATTTFNDVEPGDYTVTVTDADNCTTSQDVTIGFPASQISFATEVKPIIEANCAISGCHDGGGNLPNFNDFATLQARANNNSGGVRQRVKTMDMPRGGGSLDAAEIAAILCWVDEGAQNN